MAFRTPTQWARRLVAGSVDAVLVSVAADSCQTPAAFVPDFRNSAVEAIPLGRRPLLLLHSPSLESSGNSAPGPSGGGAQKGAGGNRRWPPQGYLLPPRDHQPCLHQLLEHSGQLPLYPCSSADPGRWLEQLVAAPLLLPADLTLLTITPWRGAGLVPLRPLNPLVEALWLLMRRGEASQQPLRQLVQWWGGQGVPLPQAESPAPQRWQRSLRWPWWRI